ncbi:galactosyldiacylglycerol synthase [Sphaerotilus mobilis]|uniref:UDP-N-acetylglucosamine:LPS N-acetylglucosamine transferase n=1 Tax=Sphaerotilus mobilis TaxID=47994 RepID=A0A4Q7LVW3_9BURK|nr:galactosyldiacylglycerol synthase [Sphaerotilus mobilis]RZS58502.1 UDP-N-acetylglucosamine:LPS N-acetylglucosamine transferase [Sphaerotilus mobilis]
MKTVDLVYFNYGGGHRAAALALEQVIAQQRRPWAVRRVDLVELLDPNEQFRKLTGLAPEDLYNQRLARGWTWGMTPELKLLQGLIRASHELICQRLSQHWLRSEPDLVVSLVPNFNRALCLSLQASLPGVPYLTVMTDIADLPPHFWIEPELAQQQIVCGSERALAQARAAGVADERLSLTTGMILRPDFHQGEVMTRERRADGLRQLGLDPSRPVGVVMFGGEGSSQIGRIAKALDDQQLILMCGRNERLAQRLSQLKRQAPHAVVGYTADVVRYLQLGSWFCGKPGPGSLSEAIHLGLPVITFRHSGTMPQERYNTEWVREHGYGHVIRSVGQLPAAVQALLADLPALQMRVRAHQNRAVFEVVDIMADVMLRSAAQAAPGLAQQGRALRLS